MLAIGTLTLACHGFMLDGSTFPAVDACSVRGTVAPQPPPPSPSRRPGARGRSLWSTFITLLTSLPAQPLCLARSHNNVGQKAARAGQALHGRSADADG
jgi:hypothetical protein